MGSLTRLYVRAENFAAYRVEKLTDKRDDKGAQGVEYAALIVLAAVIFGVLYGVGVLDVIKSGVTKAISQLFPGSAGSSG